MPVPIQSWRSIAIVASITALALRPALAQHTSPPATNLRFGISFPAARSATPLDGRIILVISNNDRREPRFENNVYDADTQLAFGIDVDSLGPGKEAYVDGGTFGYPLKSIADIPAGEYWVQAVLNKYTTFRRADGHVVKLHMDQGEGQQWNTSPGNLYNKPVKVRVDPSTDALIHLSLDQEIPPLPQPHDTKYVKYVRIQSPLLTKFWGRPMYLGAIVLLPEGFAEHPAARYPLMTDHGHFTPELRNFRETPSPNAKGADPAYELYKQWTSPGFPRMLMVTIQHANPYYDDSYAVNSENVGPYGDAINRELIPYIEQRFHGVAQGWARGMFGGSTGGWEVLATQIFYPDDYNGAWAACPDAIDFRMYEVINIYDLRYILERDWATLGPKLTGKLHLYVGTMDTWHLNNAVYLMEEFLTKAKSPAANAVVEYGDRKPHCWSGHEMAYWFRQLEDRILKTAPKGADLTSWRY